MFFEKYAKKSLYADTVLCDKIARCPISKI